MLELIGSEIKDTAKRARGRRAQHHLIFLIDCQFLVPEKMTVTEVFIQGIYIP